MMQCIFFKCFLSEAVKRVRNRKIDGVNFKNATVSKVTR